MQILRKLSVVHSILLLIAGLLLFLWVWRFLPSEPGSARRFAAVAAGTFGWLTIVCGCSVLMGRVALWRAWQPSTCAWAISLPLYTAAFACAVLDRGGVVSILVDFFFFGAWGATLLTQRLAYPKSELSKATGLTTLHLNS